MMKITGLSHLFKWENLHNWWLTKYFFAPLYIYIYIYIYSIYIYTHTHTFFYSITCILYYIYIHTLTGHFIRYTLLVPGWTPFAELP